MDKKPKGDVLRPKNVKELKEMLQHFPDDFSLLGLYPEGIGVQMAGVSLYAGPEKSKILCISVIPPSREIEIQRYNEELFNKKKPDD